MVRSTWVAVHLVVALTPAGAHARQVEPGTEAPLRLFFDCTTMGCFDPDFFRREVPVVSWVNDRQVADLHVLVTSQATGGGGRLYTMAFLGLGELEGQDQELTVSTAGDATEDERRNAVADRLKIGLVRYLAGTPAADRIRVSIEPPPGGPGGPPGGGGASGAQVDDPWNFWTFRIGVNGFLNGESSYSSANYSGNFTADRVTDAWKIQYANSYSRQRSEYDVGEDEPRVISLVESWRSNLQLVRSLSPKWSAGVTGGVGRNSRLNEHFRWNVSPGVEYDFVPYSESSRRLITLAGLLNVRHWDYSDETIYFKNRETRLAAQLIATINQVQPWGNGRVSLSWSQYLHNRAHNQLSLEGFLSVRVFRGFSVRLNGFYARIRDQLYLPIEDATTAEILLRQQALETSYNYFMSFGVSYQFGSIFNNVVNPRFGSVGESFFF